MNAWTSTPIIPRAILFGNPERSSAQISPDGRKLSYLAPRDGVMNVWVRTVGGADDRPITSDAVRGIRAYFWQAASAHIIYAQDVGGNENFHIFQTSIATGETQDLTPFDNIRASVVAVDSRHPDSMLIGMNRRDPQLFDVYRYHFKTGALELDTENPGDIAGWNADNEFEIRAATAILPGGDQEIRVRTDRNSEWRSFERWGPDESFGGVSGFSPDNRALWVISSVGANASRLLEVDIASGATRVIAEDPCYDVSAAIENPITHELEAVGFIRARLEWLFFDPAIEAEFAVLRDVRDGEVEIESRTEDDRVWIVAYSSDVAPDAYYLYDRATKKAEFLFASRPELEAFELSRTTPISVAARDGLTLHGYLTMPVGVERGAPMVLLVHGGPWARDVWGYSGIVQLLANRGYAVLSVNYRGSTGFK